MKIGNFQALQNHRFCGPENSNCTYVQDISRIFLAFKFIKNLEEV